MRKMFTNIDITDPFEILLVAMVCFGLAGKFLMTLLNSLNSDAVVPGIQAMEIFRHGNIFLSGFFFSANYSAIFTDMVPFYLIPQLLTNYDPTALKLSSFAIYALVLLVFSMIIYRLTKDRTKTLIFAALFSNLAPMSTFYFIQPAAHVSTLFFCGAIFYLLLDLDNMGICKKLALAGVVFLLTLSDKLFLILLPLSFVMAYCLILWKQKKMSLSSLAVPVIFILVPAAVAYELIPRISSFVPRPIVFYPELVPADISVFLFLGRGLSYITGLLTLLNPGLYVLTTGVVNLNSLVGLFFLMVFLFGAWNLLRNKNKYDLSMRLFLLFLIVANIFLYLSYELTNVDTEPRYLIFTTLSAFAVIALGYEGNKLYLALVSIIAITGAIGCGVYLATTSHQANSEQYSLIDHLEETHVNSGIAGFWDANVITYLSNEKVVVRAFNFGSGSFAPYQWLSDKNWYEQIPVKNHIIYNNDNNGNGNGDFGNWHANISSPASYTFGNYSIYNANVG